MKISIDNWQRNIDNGLTEIQLTSEIQAVEFLEMLNQQEKTSISITSTGERMCLLIGGGNGKYIVNIIKGNDDEFYNLLNPLASNDENFIEIKTGGQVGLFESKYVVDFLSSKTALIYFIKNNQPDPSLSWEEESF